jgi:hypothetical protein
MASCVSLSSLPSLSHKSNRQNLVFLPFTDSSYKGCVKKNSIQENFLTVLYCVDLVENRGFICLLFSYISFFIKIKFLVFLYFSKIKYQVSPILNNNVDNICAKLQIHPHYCSRKNFIDFIGSSDWAKLSIGVTTWRVCILFMLQLHLYVCSKAIIIKFK